MAEVVLMFLLVELCFVLIRFELTPEVTLLAHSASMQCPASQSALRELWRGGQADRMCALEIAKAWALHETSPELQDGKDKLPWVAARMVKSDGIHPSREALRQLFVTIDNDPDLFPGKHTMAFWLASSSTVTAQLPHSYRTVTAQLPNSYQL